MKESSGGIGVLHETTVHSALKAYFDPETAHHEVRVGKYIADVANENGIVEIQTRGFFRMRKKLEAFLKTKPVTLVYPVAVKKTIYWITPANGVCTMGRTSPKHGTVCEVWRELAGIAALLAHPNLTLKVLLLTVEEYRVLDGFGEQKKRHATRLDRCPLHIEREVTVTSPAELRQLIPEALNGEVGEFTSQEFAGYGRIPRKAAQDALRILNGYGIVKRVSHDAGGYRYRWTMPEEVPDKSIE